MVEGSTRRSARSSEKALPKNPKQMMRDPTHLPKTFLIYKTISSSKLTTFDVVKYLPRPANGSLGDGPMYDGSLSDGSIDDGSPNAGNPTAS